MRLVAMADSHNKHRQLDVPDGDVVVHAGDFCRRGNAHEATDFLRWWADLPHKHKVLVAGNHDRCFERGHPKHPQLVKQANDIGHYLVDESVVIDGVVFYGSPWTPTFNNWAFMKDRGEAMRSVWDKIDPETDVLVTHGPPFGVLDKAPKTYGGSGGLMGAPHSGATIKESVGCRELSTAIKRVSPAHHIFGHIHESRGDRRYNSTHCYNVTLLDGRYEHSYDPVVIDVERAGSPMARPFHVLPRHSKQDSW